MINWRERFLAFGIHFLVTAALGACAAALIFLVWFPYPLATMVGGTELFMLVVGCDLALGPLISLVIYNSRKSRRELLIDYTLVGIVQISALVYGVCIVAGTRPVYVAFSGDRLEVVTAREISGVELNAATEPYRSLPLGGPRYVNVVVPPNQSQDALIQSLTGNEEHHRPKFFAPYETALQEIRSHAHALDMLQKKFPARSGEIEDAAKRAGIPAERLLWLPVHHRKGFWTALIDQQTGMPVRYVALDPYGD